MKIKTQRGDNLSIEDVAKLPRIEADGGLNEDAMEILKFISVPATNENLAKAEATLPKEQRPSLEVETEVHDNLRPRIEAHLARMRAWDLRSLDPESIHAFRFILDHIQQGVEALTKRLKHLSATGFVAKTTPVTRIAAKLTRGARVDLRADKRAEYAQVYSDEQLNSLSVVKVTDTHVQLMADDGSNVGLVKVCHVRLKP